MRVGSNRGHAGGFDRQRGFTLVEALVVMIVGIVILATAAAGMGKLFRSSEISTEMSNITQIAANVRNIKASDGYQGITNELLVKMKIFPANMTQTANGVVTNSWGGDVSVEPRYENGFMITYTKVPAEACMQFALKLRNSGGGWTWFDIDDTAKKSGTSLGMDEISKLCAGGNKKIRIEAS